MPSAIARLCARSSGTGADEVPSGEVKPGARAPRGLLSADIATGVLALMDRMMETAWRAEFRVRLSLRVFFL
jgi:hypothetical protein